MDKVCGVLIEIVNNHVLVGIGCNILTAPSRARTNVSGGRPAVALVDYLDQRGEILSDKVTVSVDLAGESSPPASVHEAASDSLADSDTVPPIVVDENRSKLFSLVGQDIGLAVGRWIKGGEDSPERVITEFELWMDRGVQRLREEREGGDPVEGDETVGNGEVGEDQILGKDGGPEDYDERDVLPIGLNSDGTLQSVSVDGHMYRLRESDLCHISASEAAMSMDFTYIEVGIVESPLRLYMCA
eukprot:gene915-1026_t